MARSALHCGGTTNAEIIRSPFDRIFIRPETDLVISIAMDLKHPNIDVDAIKRQLSSTLVPSHPRFSSLLVKDRWGRDWWRKTDVNVDDHLMVVAAAGTAATNPFVVLERDAAVNAYLAELAVSPLHQLSLDKPLWEMHVLVGLGCVVMRVHHAIGDGVSLEAMLSECFGSSCNKGRKKTTVRVAAAAGSSGGGGDESRKSVLSSRWSWKKRGYALWEFMKKVWLTIGPEISLLGKILGLVKDKKSVLSGYHGVEFRPRTMVTVKFKLEDFRQVKIAVPGASQDDILMGIISSGLGRYLVSRTPNAITKGLRITALVLANLRNSRRWQDMSTLIKSETGTGWGNKFGLFQVPIDNCDAGGALQHVRKMKDIMKRRKESFEAQLLPVLLGLSISFLGLKMATWFYKRILGTTTLLVSNVPGPRKEIAIAGNPVICMKGNISSLPQQAISVLMSSYGGVAVMQISLVKDVIPDAEFLAKCFEESLAEMKTKTSNNVLSF